MSTNVIPVNNELHANLKVKNEVYLGFITDQQIAPVVVHEFAAASTNYPVVFVKNTDTDEFKPVAMMGLEVGENLFIKNNVWQGTHIPGVVHNYPFKLLALEEDTSQVVIALDHDSDLVSEEAGEPLFDADKQETPYMVERKKAVIQYFESGHVTEHFVAQIIEFDLLVERTLTVKVRDKETNLDGIYFIDEQKLNALSDEKFGILRKRGFLPLIYAHLVSLHQVQRLISLRAQKV